MRRILLPGTHADPQHRHAGIVQPQPERIIETIILHRHQSGFITGRVRRAPEWMSAVGLEWAYRLIQEPGRLFPRYARNNLPFVCRIALQGLGVTRYSLET